MPKGRKRTQADYEKEIEDTAKRMQKRPEYLHSARDTGAWQDFLIDIGITTSNAPFWEDVRGKIFVDTTGFTQRSLAEQGVVIVTGVYRGAGGRFTGTPTDRPVVAYRSFETGRFVSPKTLEK